MPPGLRCECYYWYSDWCPEPESNRYGGFTHPTDFKSVVSTNFTTRARCNRIEAEAYQDCRAGPHYTEMHDAMALTWLRATRLRTSEHGYFLDTAFNIPIMRASFFAGIAQLVERYLAKV